MFHICVVTLITLKANKKLQCSILNRAPGNIQICIDILKINNIFPVYSKFQYSQPNHFNF